MNPKKLVKEYERALQADKDNLVLRLKLAAALRDAGRRDDAVAMYRSVAVAYHKQGRLAQAIAVCRSVLEIEPAQRETQELLAQLDAAKQAATPSPAGAVGAVVPGPPPARPPSGSGASPLPGNQRQKRVSAVTPLPLLQPGSVAQPLPNEPRPAGGGGGGTTPPSDPRLPLQPPAARTSGAHPAPVVPPPAPRPAPPPAPLVRAGRGLPPDPDFLDQLSEPQVTSPERPPRRAAPPTVEPPAAPPAAPPADLVTTARGVGQGRPPARPSRPPPAVGSPPPGPPPAAPGSRPPPRTTTPARSAPPPPAAARPTAPQRPAPPAPERPAAPAPAPKAPPPRPVAATPPTPAASPAARERKKPDSISKMTPTPVSTPLPPPYPGTPTPAEAGPLGVLSPPYVATPGQEDEGNTLPTFQPRTGVPPRAAAPTSEPSLPAIPVPGAPTAAPRPNAFEEPTRLGDPIALARMAVAPPPAVPPAPPPAAMRSTRPAVAPVPPRGDYDDEGATRVAGEPGRGPDEVVPRDTQRSMPPTGGMIHTSPGRAPASGGDYDDEGATRVAGGPAGFAGGGGAPGRGPDDADSPREVPPQRVAGRPSPASSMPPIEPGDATPAPERAGRPGGAPGRDPDDDDDDDGLLAEDTQDRGHKAQSSREAPGSRDARELPPDLQAFSRSDRLLDVDWPKAPAGAIRADDTGDETNPGGGGAGAGATVAGRPPGRRSTVSRVKPVPATSDDLETQPVEKLSDTDVVREPTAAPEPSEALEDGLELAKAFDRSFSEVHDLAPDGSPIERPLPLFSQLSSPALAELKRRMSFRRCAAGDLILREGDPGDACYVIHSGSVRVLKRDPSGSTTDVIEIARLGAGALFGEFAVLADRRRHASVQALEACELYEIPRRLLRELAAEYADVGPALERFFRERLLATLLATAPFFQPLPEEDRAALMARFAPRRIDAGATIIREGERGGGLYLIVLGTVDITRRVDGRRAVLLATLGEGAYFGEMSLLSGGLASATVTAAGPVELAQLTPKDFYDIVALHPPIWEELRREAARRELVNQNILAGETAIV